MLHYPRRFLGFEMEILAMVMRGHGVFNTAAGVCQQRRAHALCPRYTVV